MKRRLSGAIWGSVLGTALAALLSVVVNPWFMDGALSYLATVVVPLSAVGWMLGTRIQPLEWPWLWGVASVVLFVRFNKNTGCSKNFLIHNHWKVLF